jgi:rubredoxin
MLRCVACGWVGEDYQAFERFQVGEQTYDCPDCSLDRNKFVVVTNISPRRVKELFATQARAQETLNAMQVVVDAYDAEIAGFAEVKRTAQALNDENLFDTACVQQREVILKQEQIVSFIERLMED